MRILVIHGHPRETSYNRALVEAYIQGARAEGADVDVLDLAALDFDPVLRHGYAEIQPLEPDLLDAPFVLEIPVTEVDPPEHFGSVVAADLVPDARDIADRLRKLADDLARLGERKHEDP